MGSATIAFETGPADVGWADFCLSLGSRSWKCRASDIGDYPLEGLVNAAVEIYYYLHRDPSAIDESIWDVTATDEPGELCLEFHPIDQENLRVRVDVADFYNQATHRRSGLERTREAEVIVRFWNFAEAVAVDAYRAIRRQGFSGLHSGWSNTRWDTGLQTVLPVERVFFLLGLVRDCSGRVSTCLDDELALLRWAEARWGALE